LKRGPVADFIGKVLSGLYRQNMDGYFALGMTDSGRWFETQISRARRLDIILPELPLFSHASPTGNAYYNVLFELAQKRCDLRLFIQKDIHKTPVHSPLEKVALHAIALLSQIPNVEIYSGYFEHTQPAQIFFEVQSNSYAARFPKDKNIFSDSPDVEISVLEEHTQTIRKYFDQLADKHRNSILNYDTVDKLLQGTKVLHIKNGQKLSWNDILSSYLPKSIKEIQIYDRFIRNRFQFSSLEMLLSVFDQLASKDGMDIEVVTTSERPEDVRGKFKELQKKHSTANNKIKYQILEPTIEIPHFRRIQIKSLNENFIIWLDRGLDIYRFEGKNSAEYTTLETYIVIEWKPFGRAS
jgi:hypothetical protein